VTQESEEELKGFLKGAHNQEETVPQIRKGGKREEQLEAPEGGVVRRRKRLKGRFPDVGQKESESWVYEQTEGEGKNGGKQRI